ALCRAQDLDVPLFIRTHGENLSRLVRRELVLDPFEQIVVPIQDHTGIGILQSMWTKFHVAYAATEAGVPANFDQQMLLRSRGIACAMRLRTHVVTQSPA